MAAWGSIPAETPVLEHGLRTKRAQKQRGPDKNWASLVITKQLLYH
jgi:hypothetical protein